MALVLRENICLTTPQGVSEVQLLFGDITLLPMTDKVDILFVSAFPGDYTPVPGTMMGALKRNLGLSVGNVAKYKELDLRKNFNCWLSKPLPSSMPYGRLVCFERMNRFEPVPEQISGMFRAMMPVFNNEDTTVITPLLATGNQGHSESMVLKSIVRAACHWIKAGLPLRCLKIVVYTRDPEHVSCANAELLNSFSELKAKWEKSKAEEVSKVQKKFDVCLSFSDGDEGLVGQICSDLLKLHTNMVIHKQQLIYNHEEVWQEKIFDVMVHSHKIVAVLTPKYLDNTECLEQFNLALCCNRLTKAEVLAPFYLQTVDAFPAYMTLIQYTECRVRRDGENAEEKIFSACSMLVCEIEKNKSARRENASGSVKGLSDREIMTKPAAPSGVYDVFISYAHKSPKEATKMYENLLDLQPDLKVFLDRSELRTGNSWQEMLYEAVDKAKVVVAFIGKNYLQSTVCMEEYNIALARYMTRDGIYFLPLLTDTDMTEIPVMLAEAPLVDMSNPSQRYEEQYCSLAEAPIRWLEALKMGEPIVNRFCHVKPPKTLLSIVTVKWRERDFEDRFAIIDQSIRLRKPCASDADTQPSSPKTVVFSFAKDSFKEAALLCHFLQQQDKVKISCEFLTSPEDSGVKAPKLQLLDSADMVVVMVSDDYLATSQHLHELHIALCRQRICKDQRVVYLVDVNHTRKKPVYAHLLQYSISLHDELWAYLARRMYVDGDAYSVNVPGSTAPVKIYCSAAEQGALTAAAVDIIDKLMAGKQEGGSGMPTNIVNLVSLMKGEQGTVPVSQCLVPFSFLLADGADSIESLLKSAPDPPAVTPGGDHPEKSPPAQHSVSPGNQNSSSNAQLPGTPDASPGTEDVSKKGPLIQQDVSLSPQAPSSNKDSTGRDAQQGPEAKGGQGKQRVVKVSRACQIS